ncbi:MAG TPA: hypothetical protein VLK35_15880 [Methylomirabilota bacterium]|nr:hypothetical protein [Methylomirabilota bacterium]
MEAYVLFAFYGLAVSVLVCLLFRQFWSQHQDREIEKKWQEREWLLDDPERRLRIVEPEPSVPLLFIVARHQRELAGFLHEDFAAEEAEGLIEILLDRRQDPQWPGAQSREADGRRDPHRNQMISTNLREIGCALVRKPVPHPAAAFSLPRRPAPVALGR